MTLSITSKVVEPALVDLPWNQPLEEWPEETIAAMPKGISRHLVRFARSGGRVVAVKETTAEMAHREYQSLRELRKRGIPAVKPLAVIENRRDQSGNELAAALVTKHLRFSLPYRAVFSQALRPETATRLVDALALLLVRLHTAGFFWGDVSLSNTLFRRDAGAFAAYLVDAETGEFPAGSLSDGQRAHDLEIARVNIAGELLDLEAGGFIDSSVDPIETAQGIVSAYENLWSELTEPEVLESVDRWRISERINRLNALGFDVEEVSVSPDPSGTRVVIQPKVVEAGHHQRRLMRLTGLDVEENQARRLLNDIDSYRASAGREMDEEQAGHEWLLNVFEPVVRSIPSELRGKLDSAEMFHQIVEHAWYLGAQKGREVPFDEVVDSYVREVLPRRRDEEELLNPTTGALTSALPVVGKRLPKGLKKTE